MDDLIIEFLTETNESLSELDTDLIKLEQNPNDKDLISKIFRLMHTIKGTCGFLGLPRLETVAHRAENVMGRFRDGDLEVTPAYVSLILESLDRVRTILEYLENNGAEPEGSDTDLIEKLDAVYEGRDAAQSTAAAPPPPPPLNLPPVEQKKELAPGEVSLEELDRIFAETAVTADYSKPEPEAKPEPVKAEAPKKEKVEAPAATGNSGGAVADSSLRVSVNVLEDLMTMVSELVLTRNQLLQIMRTNKESTFSGPLQRLNHVVSDLQDGVMKTRMQPIGNAWAKLPRIIRDLSIELGKKVDLVMVGQETELDRQVLDMIKDPLTHMVRNSADHGVEMPADRVKAGKPETGTVTLKAFHEGGHIIIQIADDGKGLNTGKIKEKIIQNGLATHDDLASMSTQQIQQYIFRAGFSTAEKVTSVSGRGVGMDVVRTNIEKIGGSIELKSEEGKGSTFTIKIPLTLAIVSSLIVQCSGERYALPQLAVRELVRVSQRSENKIEMIKGSPVFRLRNKLLPLIVLEDLLKLSSAPSTSIEAFEGKYIIVSHVGGYSFGVVVDRVFDTEEIVVKPVAKILKGIDLFSGNTILGDGTVIMILDPNGIAKAMGQTATAQLEDEQASHALALQSQAGVKTSLLLFSAGTGTPKAVPLSLVARLEKIEVDRIEYANDRMMIQYRDKLMPIVKFSPNVEIPATGYKPVLVFTDREQSVGIMVDDIIDIMEEVIDIQIDGGNNGILGSTIIRGKATEVVDVNHFLLSHSSTWFKNHDDAPYAPSNSKTTKRNGKTRILLVDDSPFFRNMLTPLLGIAGYDVVSVEGPQRALEIADKGEKFDIIISDIEMPEMSGFEFASKVRAGSPWQGTPMIALSSHATPQDIDQGFKVGFNKYVAKFDRETLLDTLSETLTETTRSL